MKNGEAALVTFASNGAAYMAFLKERANGVEIAYSWKQPLPKETEPTNVVDERMQLDEPQLKLDQLNDDCLLTLFDYCSNMSLVNLSETCKKFAHLLTNHYGFPKIDKTFVFEIRKNGDSSPTTLAETRKMLRLLGARVTGIQIEYRPYEGQYFKVHRYLQQIVKYCKGNTNVRKMLFAAAELDQNDSIRLMTPVFEHLHTLTLIMTAEFEDNFDLCNLCPNLKNLNLIAVTERVVTWAVIFANMIGHGHLHFPVKSWPTLESLFYTPRCLPLPFLVLNPQIKYLKGQIYYGNELEKLADYLPNIEVLHLEIHSRIFAQNFGQFKNLKRLTLNLAMNCIARARHTMDEISHWFNGLSAFIELEITFYGNEGPDTEQKLIILVQSIDLLEVFRLRTIRLSEDTVAAFVRFATKLKSLHLRDCGILATETLIRKIVDARKSNQGSKLKLHVDEVYCSAFKAMISNDDQQYLSVEPLTSLYYDRMRFEFQ